MLANDESAKLATEYLSQSDKILKPVIAEAGPYPIRQHKNYYQALVDSILSQQLSVKAARSIERRFCELFNETDFPAPEKILTKNVEQLRTAGLSRAKANYVRDLAEHVIDGRVKFGHLDKLSNDEIVAELTAVKGIGVWTAHMFLIFCMGRLDVLATGDLGIRNGIMKLYNFKDTPTPDEIVKLADKNHWHPYESVACWYIWQSLKNAPAL